MELGDGFATNAGADGRADAEADTDGQILGNTSELPASTERAFTVGAGQVLAVTVPCGGSGGDNQCSLRFLPVFPQKAGGSVPDPDRSPGIEPRSPRDGLNQGQAPARCVTRHSGVESCSSGARVDAGQHHTMLANTVGTAKIVKEVKVRTNTADPDLNPWVRLTPSAQDTALTPQSAAGTGFTVPGRFLASAV